MNRLKHNIWVCFFLVVLGMLFTHSYADDTVVGEVDMIVVNKSQRTLQLMKHWKPIHTFKISLGQQPVGHKQEENDSRTPEGFYMIDGKNPNSKFFRSLHISYPDAIDSYVANQKGVNPGGKIMVHGQPNDQSIHKKLKKDWTEGCIALDDKDMSIVWQLVNEGTPIIIKP